MVFFLELIGTVAFAISGAVVGIQKKMDIFGVAILAMTTGVGGGILRDVLAGNTPYVFVKHFYACAFLIGAVVCAVCWSWLGSLPSMLIGAGLIMVLRNMAVLYRWSLPKIE